MPTRVMECIDIPVLVPDEEETPTEHLAAVSACATNIEQERCIHTSMVK